MQFATIIEAFGVNSLEKDVKRPDTNRTAFEDKIFGEEVKEADEEEPIAFIPEERKTTKIEVKDFIADVYKKKGINGVWELLDPRIKRKILGMCQQSARNAKNFFDDLFTSPEKMLAILGLLFVVIILLDIGGKKKETAMPEPMQYHQMFPPQYQMYPPHMQMPPQMQMPTQLYSVNPINLNS
jgi:hypothetical protein